MKDTTGAYVAEVTKGGPAEKAGMQIGDLVKTVNGEPVKSPTDLTRRIANVGVGEKVQVGVLRNNKVVTLTLTAALRPGEDELNNIRGGKSDQDSGNGPTGTASKTPPVVGMSLKVLTPENRKAYGVGADISGLVITDLDPDSDGAQKGLKPGDVIVLANNQPMTSPADFARVVGELQKEGRPSILLLVDRDGRNIALPLSLKPADAKGK